MLTLRCSTWLSALAKSVCGVSGRCNIHHSFERSCEALVPLRPILRFQKLVGILQGFHLGQSQVLHEPVLIGAETSLHSSLGLVRQLQRIATMPTVLSKSPIHIIR